MSGAWLKQELDKLGLPAVNTPKWTPEEDTKLVVLVEYKDWLQRPVHKLIRVSNWIYGHNFSEEARASWIQKNAKKIHRKQNPEYWAYWYLWTPGADVREPGDCTRRSGFPKRGRAVK